MAEYPKFKVAAVQAAPVFLNLEASVNRACERIAQAGQNGAKLAVFPEAFLPGYPLWTWFIPTARTKELRVLYSELLSNSVAIPGPETERLCEAAREAGVIVAMGVNERNVEASGTTLYNTVVYIDADGTILGKHRKLMPTACERTVWGMGDGSTLEVYDTAIGKLGGLLCWENYMPLARFTMYAAGVQIYVAPTWDRGEPWLSTMRHNAKEGRMYVIGCCSAMTKDDIPDSFEFKAKYLADMGPWLNPGDSVVVNPDGKVIAGPLHEEAGILYAEIDPEMLLGPCFQFDAAGHYNRPDVFKLTVNREAMTMVREDPTHR